jgi:hypothetical protein
MVVIEVAGWPELSRIDLAAGAPAREPISAGGWRKYFSRRWATQWVTETCPDAGDVRRIAGTFEL